MAVGRKPKPATLKLAQGNPGHQTKKQLNRGLKVKSSRPTPPVDLSDLAMREWLRLVPLLDEMGILATADRDVIALYCETLADYIRARRELNVKPMIGKRRNPLWVTHNEAAHRLRMLMSELGLTPAARVRLDSKADAPKDEFESFVSQAG